MDLRPGSSKSHVPQIELKFKYSSFQASFFYLIRYLLSHPAAVDFFPRCLNRAVLLSGPIYLHKTAGLWFWKSKEKLGTLRLEFPSGPKFWWNSKENKETQEMSTYQYSNTENEITLCCGSFLRHCLGHRYKAPCRERNKSKITCTSKPSLIGMCRNVFKSVCTTC